MYIAMNRFKIIKGKENSFEQIWTNRSSYLGETKGFKSFNLVKGSESKEYTLYASHSVWESQLDFRNWVKSDAFRKAHSDTEKNKNLYIGYPEFEGFIVVL